MDSGKSHMSYSRSFRQASGLATVSPEVARGSATAICCSGGPPSTYSPRPPRPPTWRTGNLSLYAVTNHETECKKTNARKHN